MNKIKQYKIHFIKVLSPLYEQPEIESFFFLILNHTKNASRIDLALNPDMTFSEEELKKVNYYLEELKKFRPIQYLLGVTDFFGLEFFVNDHTLIPRPETEELVNWVLENNQAKSHLKILDIGTGSGCIAVSLSKNINAEIIAFDISEKALKIAHKNADHNRTFVHFIEFDILNDVWEGQKFDIIVSNPPYVRECEKEYIKPNVLEYEPKLALFVPDQNPLLFYNKIADFALKHLSQNGQLYFEINQYLAKELMEMLREKGFQKIILKKDIYDKDRMIWASK